MVLGTILALLAPAEFAARLLFPERQVDACEIEDGPVFRGRPDCISRTKAAEGPWAVNRYNACGYRTPEPCGAKPPGSLRVAVVGASTSAGYLTPYEDTMAARAARALTSLCRRPVEFQDLGAAGNYGERLVASAREALGLAPDLMLVVIAPIDFERADEPWRVKAPQSSLQAAPGLFSRLRGWVGASRLLYMESYFLLRNDDVYVPLFLGSGNKADFMRTPFSLTWQRRLGAFDAVLSQIAAMTKARGVTALLLYVPQRAQASLAAAGGARDGFDPELLPDALGRMAAAEGMAFLDVTRAIPAETPSAALFYAVNGHPNGRGHALMADSLVSRMLGPDTGAFARACGVR